MFRVKPFLSLFVIGALLLAVFTAAPGLARSLDSPALQETPPAQEEPTAEPPAEPTSAPVEEPTSVPQPEQPIAPTEVPPAEPTSAPVQEPTSEPPVEPTEPPPAEPTAVPTSAPAEGPQPVQPAISINIPLPGEVTSHVEVVVTGSGTALPENNVVVQALTAGGALLDQTATIVNAPLGGTGDWSATVHPDAEPGTPGRIVAFATSPATGQVIAQAEVAVQYGQPSQPTPEPTAEPVEPAISIDIPLQGEVTSNVEVVVAGTGTALPENNVVVQALDLNGRLLDETATTVDAPLGGSGEWRTTVYPDVELGTPGRIVAFANSPATGQVIAQATVNVTFGQAGPTPTPTPSPTPIPPVSPAIRIDIPVDGEITSNVEVVVIGTGSALPENNVVVQALDGQGRVLDQKATTIDAPLGGTGEWRITLRPNAAPGTPGRIVALSRSPADGRILAQDTVNVSFGRAQAQPAIHITEPDEGAVLRSDRAIRVEGTAQNLFENNVVVQVIAVDGRLLAEQPTTVRQDGRWSLDLNVGLVSTPATIYAFAPSPVDGSVMAYDEVSVLLIKPAPPPPANAFVTILDPTNNSTVNARGFVVYGAAGQLAQNNVIVRVRDTQDQTLRQAVATVGPDGSWNAHFDLLIADGAAGNIYAFSTSPSTGKIVAQNEVRVTFASPCTPRTDWPVYTVQRGDTLFRIAQATGSSVAELTYANCLPNPNLIVTGQRLYVPRLPQPVEVVVPPAVEIADPIGDDELTLTAPVKVTGSAAGVAEGSVFVRVLDNLGNVLAEDRAAVTEPTGPDGVWQWEVDLNVTPAAEGRRGTVFAYSPSPMDGVVDAADGVNVRLGPSGRPQFVTIEDPLPYAQVSLENGVTVSGRGAALFENNVVVQALDDLGNVIATVPTTIQTDEVGGEGEWQAILPVDYVGRGKLIAFATSPENGSTVAEFVVDVYFGDPASLGSFVLITFPLPGTIVQGSAPSYAIAGYAGGAVESVQVLALDADGRILLALPAAVIPETGFWSLSLTGPLPVSADRRLTLQAFATHPETGHLAGADAVSIQLRQPEVTGTVVYRQQIALPSDAVMTVRVQNLSIMDAPPSVTILGERTITTGGSQFPIPFAVPYDPAAVDERVEYGVFARIEDGAGNLLFLNTSPVKVLTQGNPFTDVEVMVEMVP